MATKARLHWFWRGMMSISPALVLGGAVVEDLTGRGRWIEYVTQPITQGLLVLGLNWRQGSVLAVAILAVLVPLLAAFGAYGLLTHWFGVRPADGELHCRRCHYILRGLSEPRCPECGEAI